MNDVRSVSRTRLALIVALTAVIALASFWTVEVMRRTAEKESVPRPAGQPDFYVEKFNFVKTSPTGQIQYHISGEKLTHYPEDGSYVIHGPIVNSVLEEGAPMKTRANRAVVNNKQSHIHLYGNVVSERPKTGANAYFRLGSEYLLILPEKDTMQTDKPVEILFNESRLTGVGMLANQATRQFRILNNARAIYQPPTAKSLH